MPLQVWLPLNGNLNNQGLSNVTVTNNNSTVDNNGKFGKCYSFNGSNTHIRISMPPSMKSIKNSSIAVWVKSTSSTAAVGGISNDGGNNLACMTLFTNQWQFASGSAWKYINTGNFANTGVWHHLACTVDDTTIRTYMDGTLVTSSTLTALGVGVTDITSSNFIEIGCDHPGGDEMLTGLVNDFRVYDHCLSDKEIKEISKGLILHYSLDGSGRSADNLFRGSAMTAAERASTGFIDNGSTDWTKPFRYYNGNVNIHSFSNNIDTITLNSTGNLGIAFQRKATDISLDSSSYYTISCEARCTKANAQLAIGLSYYNTSNSWVWRGGSNTQNFNNTTDWQKFSLTFKPDADTQYIMYCLTVYQATASASEIFQIRNCKMEKGSVATPWCPNSADVEFGNMGLNSTSVKDSSGFNNNGTLTGAIIYDSNTPRNSVCSYIADGSVSKITAPIFLNNDKCTMSMWVRSKNGITGFNSYHIPFNIDGAQFEFSIDPDGKFRNGFYVNGARVVNTTPNPNILDKNWHMITATFDGSNIKRYVDGVLVQTQAASGTLTGGSHTVYIGGPYGNTNNYYSKELYESDVRYYCTALSAEDIKDLYQVSSHICNNGTMMAYNFVEN